MRVLDFWAMTPRETQQVIAAENWRTEQEQQRDTVLAWHVAMLTRAKKLPSLRALLHPRKGALTDEEKAGRQSEFEELTGRMVRTKNGR